MDASIEKFRKNHERGSREKFHCLRSPAIRRGDEFGIFLGFTANDPKFFLLAISCLPAGRLSDFF
jgi:hypothetical protein